MNSPWKRTYKGEIGGRPVEVECHDEGGCRVRTTQGEDSAGDVSADSGSITVIPPFEKGRVIEIEAETAGDVRDQLIQEGFSPEEADEIVNYCESSPSSGR
jgi:hypothetical protein